MPEEFDFFKKKEKTIGVNLKLKWNTNIKSRSIYLLNY